MFDSVNHIISQRRIRYLDRCAEPSRVPKDDFIRKLSRLTDCEEALLLGRPPIGPFLDKRKFMAEAQERARVPYIPLYPRPEAPGLYGQTGKIGARVGGTH